VVVIVAGLVVIFILLSVASQLGHLHHVRIELSPFWLLASIALFIAFEGIQAELWRRLLADLGGPLPRVEAWAMWSVSLLARYVPTQVLMAVTRIEWAKRAGVPRRISVASIVYEFGLAVGTAMALAVAPLIALPGLRHEPLRWALVAVPVGLLVVLHPAILRRVMTFAGRRLRASVLDRQLSPAQLIAYALLYAASFVIANVALVAFAYGVTDVGDPTFEFYNAYTVGYCAAVLAFFIPAGLGARDGATVVMLATVMPLGESVFVAVGVRLLQSLIEVLWAAVTTVVLRRTQARPVVVA
jgi:hypothetical protein